MMPTSVFVALGSNIQPEDNLRRAVSMLRAHDITMSISSVYETPQQGFTNQANFLNMAARLQTELTIEAFKVFLTEIERNLKRVRDPQNVNAPRTIDLDIALWGNAVMDYGDKPWHVPDKDILRFAHVALPLAELAPQMPHPETGQSLADIATQFDSKAIKIRAELSSKLDSR